MSEGCIYSVMDAIEGIHPKLNLHKQPPAKNFSPAQAKLYLEGHSLKYCVLVVDGETIQDCYEHLPARKDEYEDLLKTAVKRVGKISSLYSISSLNVSLERTPGKELFKVVPLIWTAHPLLRKILRHPRWRRFFPLQS